MRESSHVNWDAKHMQPIEIVLRIPHTTIECVSVWNGFSDDSWEKIDAKSANYHLALHGVESFLYYIPK